MVEGSKHTDKHDKWDAGGYCNELVLDENGYAEVCGYQKSVAKKFRKKPVVIEAMKTNYWYDDATREKFYGNIYEVVDWIDAGGGKAKIVHDPSGEFGIEIRTLEGTMHVGYGDYVIKGVEGEFYPCKPDIFEKTYEAADD